MRNFLQIGAGLDVIPLLLALQNHPELWNADAVRSTFEESPHRDVQDILLRFSDTSAENIGDQLLCHNMPAMAVLPQARPLIYWLMARVEGDMLGRVMITKLAPGKRIFPHSDVLGLYANTMNRFHIPLQSGPGCMFRAGTEQVTMQPGDAWDFNAHAEHEVINNSADDRIHLIVDIRVAK
jgi:hypothetical protein